MHGRGGERMASLRLPLARSINREVLRCMLVWLIESASGRHIEGAVQDNSPRNGSRVSGALNACAQGQVNAGAQRQVSGMCSSSSLVLSLTDALGSRTHRNGAHPCLQ